MFLVLIKFSIWDASAQLTITPGATSAQLISAFAGQGLVVSNLTINCNSQAYGTFTNSGGNLSMSNGMILTSGAATNAKGPNNVGSASSCVGTQYNDPQLLSIDNRAKYDVCIIQFDIVPQCNSIQIKFVFGSEEYPEYVNSSFNDAFGFFITGPGPNCSGTAYNNTNVATLPNNTTPVSIDNVNGGANSSYYVTNPSNSTIQYDGMTTALTRTVTLCPCQSYHFKIAIADAGDCAYDSGVFVDFIQCSNPLLGTATAVAPVCGCTGSATANPTGGLAPYTYLWNNGQTTQTINNLCPGDYSCTISDQLSCTVPKVVNVTVPNGNSNLTLTTSQTNVGCNGGSDGTATVNASGMAGPYTYSWSPSGGSGQSASGLSAGVYTVTVSANGCSSQTNVTITEPPALTSTQSQTNVLCNAACNGTATVLPSGGNGSYTYSWLPSGGNSTTASNLCAGNYTCTISSGAGCSISKSFTITEPSVLTASQNQTDVSCFGGANGTASVNPLGGSGAYSYSWSPSGGAASSANGFSVGNYSCLITDMNGCSLTKNFTINQPSQITANQSSTDASCNGICDGTATVSGVAGGTGTFSYSWSPSGGSSATANALCAGNYICTISDVNGCFITKSILLIEPAVLSASITNTVNVSCFGYSDGSATILGSGGVAPYSYSWTNGDMLATALNLTAGNHTATVTDANNCIATVVANISQPSAFSVDISSTTNVSCFGGNDGEAVAIANGGTPNYVYSWIPAGGTSANGSGFIQGSYTITATDAQGCTATAVATITEPDILVQTITSSTNVSCFGGNDGTATLGVSGGTFPFTNIWTNGQTNTQTATNLAAGNYTTTLTDANGCTATTQVTISEPPILTATIASTDDVNCSGGNDGSAVALATGGTAPISYSWNNGDIQPNAINLPVGNYTVTATDINNCTATAVATINEPSQLIATISSTVDASCFGYNDGSALVAVNGGFGQYIYSWTNGDIQASALNLAAGNHTVTVTDENGCIATAIASIAEPPLFTVIVSTTTDVSCFGGNDGTATASVTGGTPSYNYNWIPIGGGTSIGTNLVSGTYTVTATDGQGCTATADAIINEPTQLLATISSTTDVSCFGGNDGTATVSISGGTQTYTIIWQSGGNALTETSLAMGSYNVIITDALGCNTNTNATINEPTELTASVDATTDVTCFGYGDGTATLLASGGTPPYSFIWPDGSNSQAYTNLVPSNYQININDAMGCATLLSFNISEPPILQITNTNTIDASCYGVANGAIDISVGGGTIPYTYVWTSTDPAIGGISEDLLDLPAGDYTVVVTDGFGCNITQTSTVTQPTAIESTTSSTNVSCYGLSDGEITITVTGSVPPYTYSWNNGGTQAILSGISIGSYTVIITDAQNCQTTETVTITEPPLLAGSINSEDVSCNGYSNGTAEYVVTGGTPPYIIIWNNGQNSNSIHNLSAGVYTVNATDSNGCQVSSITEVTEPDVLEAKITSEDDILGMEYFNITSIVQGGTPGYQYQWLPDSLSNCQACDTFVGRVNEDTEIILIVRDTNNCVTSDTVRVRIIDNVVYIPNAFSPNEDDKNEIFKVYAPPGVVEYSMRIFDRWGEQHFLSNDIEIGWDGKIKGKIKVDVYVYKVTLKYPNGKVKNLTGTVTLL